GPNGGVAVGFYDRRAACPSGPSIIRQDVGRTNFCIDTTVQAYHDDGNGAVPIGANIRVSKDTWDPQQPGLLVNANGTTTNLQTLGGLGQMACSAHDDPCTGSFIGDYFGLAISGRTSTRCPSRRTTGPASKRRTARRSITNNRCWVRSAGRAPAFDNRGRRGLAAPHEPVTGGMATGAVPPLSF